MPTPKAPHALVVDDDAVIRLDAIQILRDAGFQTLDAETADAAKLILEAHGDNLISCTQPDPPGG